jgi:hypothetical protein
MDEPWARESDDELGLAFTTLVKLLEMRGLTPSLAPELALVEGLVASAAASGKRAVDEPARRAIRDLQLRAMRIMPATTPADRRRRPDRGAAATEDRSALAHGTPGPEGDRPGPPGTASLDDAEGSRATGPAHALPATRLP